MADHNQKLNASTIWGIGFTALGIVNWLSLREVPSYDEEHNSYYSIITNLFAQDKIVDKSLIVFLVGILLLIISLLILRKSDIRTTFSKLIYGNSLAVKLLSKRIFRNVLYKFLVIIPLLVIFFWIINVLQDLQSISFMETKELIWKIYLASLLFIFLFHNLEIEIRESTQIGGASGGGYINSKDIAQIISLRSEYDLMFIKEKTNKWILVRNDYIPLLYKEAYIFNVQKNLSHHFQNLSIKSNVYEIDLNIELRFNIPEQELILNDNQIRIFDSELANQEKIKDNLIIALGKTLSSSSYANVYKKFYESFSVGELSLSSSALIILQNNIASFISGLKNDFKLVEYDLKDTIYSMIDSRLHGKEHQEIIIEELIKGLNSKLELSEEQQNDIRTAITLFNDTVTNKVNKKIDQCLSQVQKVKWIAIKEEWWNEVKIKVNQSLSRLYEIVLTSNTFNKMETEVEEIRKNILKLSTLVQERRLNTESKVIDAQIDTLKELAKTISTMKPSDTISKLNETFSNLRSSLEKKDEKQLPQSINNQEIAKRIYEVANLARTQLSNKEVTEDEKIEHLITSLKEDNRTRHLFRKMNKGDIELFTHNLIEWLSKKHQKQMIKEIEEFIVKQGWSLNAELKIEEDDDI